MTMEKRKSLSIRFFWSWTLLSATFLVLSGLLRPAQGALTQERAGDFTLVVRMTGGVSVPTHDLSAYFRAVSIGPDRVRVSDLKEPVELGRGDEVRVIVREGLDVFEFAQPVPAVMNAAVYLGKKIRVDALLGADMAGKRATIMVQQTGLVVTEKGTMDPANPQGAGFGQGTLVVFDDEIVARTRRVIGVQPIRRKSFEVPDRWISGGEEVRIKIPLSDFDREGSQLAVGFWIDRPVSGLEEEAYLADITALGEEKTGRGIYIVKARAPYLSELDFARPGWYCPYPAKVKMTVTSKFDENRIVTEHFDLRVARRGWGIAGGGIFLVIVFLFVMQVTRDRSPFEDGSVSDQRYRAKYKKDWLKRFFFSPMDFAVTPIGTYSISKAQALFWTCLVAFSCVYVYVLKAAFIMIPAQILILLGLTGGTALASRINAVSKDATVPKEILNEVKGIVQRQGRIPRLRDMISIGGRMNVYKFQMVVFTLITGIIVFVELIKGFNFPEIPDTLIVLMGVSNTLYLGNEVSVDPMKKVRDMVADYEKEEDRNEKRKLKRKIKEALVDCYQTS
jgi:hypothetical protein